MMPSHISVGSKEFFIFEGCERSGRLEGTESPRLNRV